jgi:drug/metabolite transporter (DMT)-like permease
MLTRIAPFIFVILWATGFIGARFGLDYAEPMTFLFIRMVANVLVFIVLMLLFKAELPKGRACFHAFVSGILIHGFYLGGTYIGIAFGMPAGLCSLLVGLQPILTAVFLISTTNRSLRLSQWCGLVIGFIGITLVLQGNITWQSYDHVEGAFFFTIMALLGITFGTLYQKRFCQGVDMIGAAVWQYMGAGLLFLPIALTTETMVVQWTPQFIFTLLWLVFALSVVAVLLLLYMVKHGESSKVASVFYLVPPTTAFQAWLVFDERFDLFGAVGFACAALAVYLVVRKPSLTH